jgi:holliday junction DNA helicase RuvA
MIASVRGRVLAADREGLVIEVGGVGLRVHATAAAQQAARASPEQVFLQAHLVVREDALQLYGFASEDERELFLALLGVSGVGPKASLSILSAYAPARLRLAIASQDAALLTSVSGIGKKTAERIVVELRDKLGAPSTAPVAGSALRPVPTDDHALAREGLVGLGYSVVEAEEALAATSGTPEERIRQALATLGMAS